MVGMWILLLLACGGIVVQGNRNSNSNANSNSNFFYGRHQTPSLPSNEKYSDHPIASLENTRRILYNENDIKTASVATAAADAALSITKMLINDLSETVAIAVAECIAKILKRQSSLTSYRRSTLPLMLAEADLSDTSNESGDGDKALEYEDIPYGSDIPQGLSYSNDVDEDEESEANKLRLGWDRLVSSDDYPENSNINSNINSNTNINTNSFRRNAVRENFKTNTENGPNKPWEVPGGSRRWRGRPAPTTTRPPLTLPNGYFNRRRHQ